MKIQVISIMPELIRSMLTDGVVGSAFQKGICTLEVINPRSFTEDVHQSVDDRPFGGGDGMVMLAEPLEKSLEAIKPYDETTVFYLSPQGKVLDDEMTTELSKKKEITLICGRYAGVDQRFLVKNKIQEISIGDYVLSGGELGALVIIDAVLRKIPGVLGHVDSAKEDSFANNGLLEAPSFTRPREVLGLEVPEVLLSGDHKRIAEFKEYGAVLTTLQKRPQIVESVKIKDWNKIKDFLENLSEKDCQVCGWNREMLLVRMKEIKK